MNIEQAMEYSHCSHLQDADRWALDTLAAEVRRLRYHLTELGKAQIEAATTADEIDVAMDLIRYAGSEKLQADLRAMVEKKRGTL